ncbi:hypothetical protein MKW98_005282 [Papaver atlanticum]|uniref:Uncharacterized protein n=1 Tax=Papaver atlanticum TaxID=357466 RepID=A0AAD4RWV3_9MAGN|nr:hypothetical protein MKW98_005282 [Papaver atlanticum]
MCLFSWSLWYSEYIFFQSERRGLTVSDCLGYGFICNGNNVAYLAGSAVPLKMFRKLLKSNFRRYLFQVDRDHQFPHHTSLHWGSPSRAQYCQHLSHRCYSRE